MLTTLAVAHYRSLHDLVVPLGPLNVVTGPNGSGKSNLYRALRLLAETGRDGVVSALRGKAAAIDTLCRPPVHRKKTPCVCARFAGRTRFASRSACRPIRAMTQFNLDRRSARMLWAGPFYRPRPADRLQGAMVRGRA